MTVRIGVRPHVNFVMAVFDPWNYLQIAHWKASVKGDIRFRRTQLIIKPVKYDIFPLLFYDLFVSILPDWLVDERRVFNVLNGLYFEFRSFQFSSVLMASELSGNGVRETFVIDGELLFCFNKALLIIVFFNFII
jgi:hypothetical protein